MTTNATLVQDVNNGFIRTVELIKLVRDNTKASMGDLTTLNTTDKTSLINAINEILTMINNKSSIDDSQKTTSNTWSASKIDTYITSEINKLIGGADDNNDTLKELADKITALVQADNGLLSFAQTQTLSETEQAKGQANLNVYGKNKIGDIENADFVATINSVYQE